MPRKWERFNVDLVGDYAGSEFFVIDGNSFLFHAFSNLNLDFTNGLQLLHATYIVEQLLAACINRRCVFSLVFLEDSKNGCVPLPSPYPWKFLLARETIISHLRHAQIGTDLLHVFSSFDDLEFRKYLTRTRPLFVMCHSPKIPKADDEAEEEEETTRNILLYGCAQRWMNLGFNLSLMDTMHIRENKVFTDVLQLDEFRDPNYLRDDLREPRPSPAEPHYSAPPWAQSLTSSRETLAVAVLVHLLESGEESDQLDFAPEFLAHIALLSTLALPYRHLRPVESPPTEAVDFLEQISRTSTRILSLHQYSFSGKTNDIADYLDGTLFFTTVQHHPSLPPAALLKFQQLADIVKSVCGVTLNFSPSRIDSSPSPVTKVAVLKPKSFQLLPFQSEILEPYLAKVKLSSDVGLSPSADDDGKAVYREKYHWHNSKKPLITKSAHHSRPIIHRTGKGNQGLRLYEKRILGRARKWEQVYLNLMFRYAASLTGSVTGALDAKTIIVEQIPEGSRPRQIMGKKQGEREKPPQATSKKGKTSTGKSADAIRQENLAKKGEALSQRFTRSWGTFCQASGGSDERMVESIDEWISKNRPRAPLEPTAQEAWLLVEVEARLYKIRLLQRIWADYNHTGKRNLGWLSVAQLFDESRKVLRSSGLSRKAFRIIKYVFKGLKIAMPPISSPESLPKHKLSDFLGDWDGTYHLQTRLDMSSEVFQLTHCGPLMDRDMDSAPDRRVEFEPDGWQRKVLDEIDRNNSIFVVAPTSAGKTFIAFYAMEKVLKADDEGVLVYVAPTKALVNQIAAEVISRFSKTYKHPGKTVWAIHTRDYRVNNPASCQILVTVPHILQIMLLAPTNATTWAPKVKRIIFDEVHSIGNSEDGLVWEQLLLMAPCPIIALSATVGNPNEFSSWLNTTQGTIGTKFTDIYHAHRYSDLRKYIYTAWQDDDSPIWLDTQVSKFSSLETHPDARYIHPLTSVSVNTQELPPDLTFEARDCLLAYNAMKAVENSLDENLDYRNFFGTDGRVIKKADVVKWEAALKHQLQDWLKKRDSPFRKVVEILKDGRGDGGQSLSLQVNGKENTKKYLQKTLLKLLQSLHTSNALPAIVFQYSRDMCERLCERICDELGQAEAEFKEIDPAFRHKHNEFQKRKTAKPQKPARRALAEGETKEGRLRDHSEANYDAFDGFDPNDFLPEFSFADYKKHSRADLQTDCANLLRWDIPQKLVTALKRGIGVHHSGMNRKYRQIVEMLFRKGFLRVVIATGTLALGINMPTKTSIFSGNSVYLTALNYRQAAGRAGRRGFDNLGNVVFHGIAESQVFRLMSSKLPSLLGHFPLSTSLILRLFILLHNSEDSDYAQRAINQLLRQNRLILGGTTYEDQVLHHLRFSIEFLRRQHLLGVDGKPLNFAGMVTHMYFTENSAFALHALLYSGDLQRICEDINKEPDSTCLSLMLILAHLFGRIPALPKVKRLPDLPSEIRETLKKESREITQVYTAYVQTYAREHLHTPDDRLPLSQTQFGGSHPFPFALPPVTARSSFVALSGHGDRFASTSELAETARSGLFIESAVIPELPLDPPGGNCNSYLYDFYKHGDTDALRQNNGIRKADVWFKLKDFSLILATIEAGLRCYIRDGPGAYYDFISEEDEEEITVTEPDADGTSTPGTKVGEDEWQSGSVGVGTEDGATAADSDLDSDDDSDLEKTAPPSALNIVKVWKTVHLLQKNFETKFKGMWA